MHSSTSSSEAQADMSKYDRPLPPNPLGVAAMIAVVVAVILMSGWEMYWRANDAVPSYRNSEGLWAIQRRRINRGEGDKTVIIGSSRIFFNTQLNIWEKEAGERPIQLGLEGTTPVPLMEALADDPDFTGILFVGVASGIFFSDFRYRADALQRYDEESPAQWMGQHISMLVEPYFAFYHSDYSLFTVLKRQAWPKRDTIFTPSDVRRLATYGKDRSARLFSKVETDEAYAERAKEIWAEEFVHGPPPTAEMIQEMMASRDVEMEKAVSATNKLQERGVEVIFVRMPYEGIYAEVEPMGYPRAENWDVLIERTGALGLHWEDHAEMQGYWLPEWSHMSGSEADRFTKAFYGLIERERQARGDTALD
jgi:hypothetical protein